MNTHTMNIHNCTSVTISAEETLERPDGSEFYTRKYRFEHEDGSHLTVTTICDNHIVPKIDTE